METVTPTDEIFFDGKIHNGVFFEGKEHKEAWMEVDGILQCVWRLSDSLTYYQLDKMAFYYDTSNYRVYLKSLDESIESLFEEICWVNLFNGVGKYLDNYGIVDYYGGDVIYDKDIFGHAGVGTYELQESKVNCFKTSLDNVEDLKPGLLYYDTAFKASMPTYPEDSKFEGFVVFSSPGGALTQTLSYVIGSDNRVTFYSRWYYVRKDNQHGVNIAELDETYIGSNKKTKTIFNISVLFNRYSQFLVKQKTSSEFEYYLYDADSNSYGIHPVTTLFDSEGMTEDELSRDQLAVYCTYRGVFYDYLNLHNYRTADNLFFTVDNKVFKKIKRFFYVDVDGVKTLGLITPYLSTVVSSVYYGEVGFCEGYYYFNANMFQKHIDDWMPSTFSDFSAIVKTKDFNTYETFIIVYSDPTKNSISTSDGKTFNNVTQAKVKYYDKYMYKNGIVIHQDNTFGIHVVQSDGTVTDISVTKGERIIDNKFIDEDEV